MKLHSLAILATIACVTLPVSASAQSIVGASMIDGKAVQLFSDGTWAFVEMPKPRCYAIAKTVEFCPAEIGYENVEIGNHPQVDALFKLDDRQYAMFIGEELGRADGVSPEFVFRTTLEHVARMSGKGFTDIPVTNAYPQEIAGRPAETITYTATINGLNVVYFNTVLVEDHLTLQSISYYVADVPTDAHRDQHDVFLTAISIEEAAE